MAKSITSRAVSSGGRSFSPLSERSLSSARCKRKTARICVNMSAAMVVSTSLDRLGLIPASSACWIGGMPWRIAISIGQAIESQPPVSLIRLHRARGVRIGEVDIDVVVLHQAFVAELDDIRRAQAAIATDHMGEDAQSELARDAATDPC